MKTIFSGIQPSGNLHIGNYIGALSQWNKMQNEYDSLFCIVDLHAITVPQDPKVLREKVREVAALYLACGIDPNKSHIFVQSQNPDHTYLAWIFNTITPMGWLNRMTQYKEKSAKQESDSESVGLFDYPALMAADILLYDTDEVPVGEDQKQHIELTRDIAVKFNKTFGETFKLPNPHIQKETARIMSLQNPNSKMSKSDKDRLGTISLLDSEDEILEKVKKAVTDSGRKVGDEKSPAMVNLMTIYASITGADLNGAFATNEGKSYSEFKQDLAVTLASFLAPIREKYEDLRNDETFLDSVLKEGLEYSSGISTKKIKEVKQKVGLA